MIFINTSPPEERVHLLSELLSEIEHMEDDSKEIHAGGLLKWYVERPHSVENVTLADWAAWYDSCCSKPYEPKKSSKLDIDCLPEETINDENNDDEIYAHEELLKSNNVLNKSQIARIIRSVWFNKEINSQNHYRELVLMLFTHWRNEEADLLGNTPPMKIII